MFPRGYSGWLCQGQKARICKHRLADSIQLHDDQFSPWRTKGAVDHKMCNCKKGVWDGEVGSEKGPRLRLRCLAIKIEAMYTLAAGPGEICTSFKAVVLNTGNTSELPGELLQNTSTQTLLSVLLRPLFQNSPKWLDHTAQMENHWFKG